MNYIVPLLFIIKHGSGLKVALKLKKETKTNQTYVNTNTPKRILSAQHNTIKIKYILK